MADQHEPLDLAWDPEDESASPVNKPAPEKPQEAGEETFGLAEDSGEHESIGLAYDPDVDQGQSPKPEPQPASKPRGSTAAQRPPATSSGTPFSGEEPPAVDPEEAARRREEQRRRAAEEHDRGEAVKGKLKLLAILVVVGGFLLLWVMGLVRNWLS